MSPTVIIHFYFSSQLPLHISEFLFSHIQDSNGSLKWIWNGMLFLVSNYKSLLLPPTFKLIHLFTEREEKHFLTYFFSLSLYRHQPFQVCFLTEVVWCSQVVLLAVGICLQVSSLKTQLTTLWAFWQLTRAFNLLSEIGCRNLCDTNRRNLLEVSAEWLIIITAFFSLSRHFNRINSDLTAIKVSTKSQKFMYLIILLSLGRFTLGNSIIFTAKFQAKFKAHSKM